MTAPIATSATATAPTALADRVATLAAQVAELKSQRVTYIQTPVTAADTTTSTFSALVASQTDGATVTVAGISSPPQFLPAVGSTVTVALQGATPIYQPTQVAAGAITPTNLSPNAPGAPTGLNLSTSTTLASDGTVQGSITATWTPPTVTVGGTAIAGALTFNVQYRPTGNVNWANQASPTPTAVIAAASGASFDVQVAAVDQVGNIGAYTAVATITVGKDTTPPSPPSTPVVGNYLGQLKVTWDGKLTGGVAPPADFSYVEVHASATSGFTPSTTTRVADLATGGVAYATAPYGTTTYVVLIAVDYSGNRSGASAQASGATSQVVSADILAGAVGAAQLASLSVSTANMVDGAVINSKIAAGAVGTTSIASAAITTALIGDLQVATAKIADGAIQTVKIGTAAVGTAQIANLAVASANIADAAVVNAKIGSLAVNDAKIGNMAVGKLTAGTMSADVVMSGRFATALTGVRTEMNSLGFQKFNASGGLDVSITSTETILHGTFRTSATGRRVEILAGGSTSQIDFYGPAGDHCFVKAYTESAGIESVQLCMDMGGHYLWNRINISEGEMITIHHRVIDNNILNPLLSANSGAAFIVRQYDSRTNFNTNNFFRMSIDANFAYWDVRGVQRILIADGAPNSKMSFMPRGPGNGGIDIIDNLNTGPQSARMMFTQQDGGGVLVKAYANYLEHRGLGDDVFFGLKGSEFLVPSDADGKTDIVDANLDAATIVKGLRVRSYKRKRGKDKDGNDRPDGPTEIGLVAQEAPPQIVVTGDSDGGSGVALYQYTTLLAAGLQQALARIEALEGKKVKP